MILLLPFPWFSWHTVDYNSRTPLALSSFTLSINWLQSRLDAAKCLRIALTLSSNVSIQTFLPHSHQHYLWGHLDHLWAQRVWIAEFIITEVLQDCRTSQSVMVLMELHLEEVPMNFPFTTRVIITTILTMHPLASYFLHRIYHLQHPANPNSFSRFMVASLVAIRSRTNLVCWNYC